MNDEVVKEYKSTSEVVGSMAKDFTEGSIAGFETEWK